MIVDIIIIAIMALSIFLGYRKGLIELGVSLCAVIIAVVATLILYKPITNIIVNATSLDETIQQTIIEKVSTIETEAEIEQIEDQVATEISRNIIKTGVIIILYVAIRIALRFVTALANLVAKLPVIDQVNKIGGILFGAIRGVLLIYIVLLIISFIGQVNSQNKLHTEIEKSFIGKEMYNHNVINLLLK